MRLSVDALRKAVLRSCMFCAAPASTGGVGVGPVVRPVASRRGEPDRLRLLIGLGEEAAEPRRLDLLGPALRLRIRRGRRDVTVFGAAPALRIGLPRSPGSGGPSGGAWRGRPV